MEERRTRTVIAEIKYINNNNLAIHSENLKKNYDWEWDFNEKGTLGMGLDPPLQDPPKRQSHSWKIC